MAFLYILKSHEAQEQSWPSNTALPLARLYEAPQYFTGHGAATSLGNFARPPQTGSSAPSSDRGQCCSPPQRNASAKARPSSSALLPILGARATGGVAGCWSGSGEAAAAVGAAAGGMSWCSVAGGAVHSEGIQEAASAKQKEESG